MATNENQTVHDFIRQMESLTPARKSIACENYIATWQVPEFAREDLVVFVGYAIVGDCFIRKPKFNEWLNKIKQKGFDYSVKFKPYQLA